jgi:hypothetical protein
VGFGPPPLGVGAVARGVGFGLALCREAGALRGALLAGADLRGLATDLEGEGGDDEAPKRLKPGFGAGGGGGGFGGGLKSPKSPLGSGGGGGGGGGGGRKRDPRSNPPRNGGALSSFFMKMLVWVRPRAMGACERHWTMGPVSPSTPGTRKMASPAMAEILQSRLFPRQSKMLRALGVCVELAPARRR